LIAQHKKIKEGAMKALVFAFVLNVVPLTAEARDAVTYAVDGETFEGYRAEAKGASKGLILIIHDWDGLTEYEMKRSEMLADMGYDALPSICSEKATARPTPLPKRRRPASSTRTESACAA
jgi:dienelactone hydrolase